MGPCFADVGDPVQIEAVFKVQREQFGGLDVLVNNAGIAGPTAGIDAITDEEWQRTIDINLTGQYRFAHHAVPLLKASPNAHLIHIASVAGRLGYAWRTPYAATKWAIIGLMKSLASELGESDIRVNALLPGIVEGPRMDGVIRARAEQMNVPEAEMREEYLKKISLKRMVTAEDVAAMALFLCSPAARNVTGQAISVDGNVVRSARRHWRASRGPGTHAPYGRPPVRRRLPMVDSRRRSQSDSAGDHGPVDGQPCARRP